MSSPSITLEEFRPLRDYIEKHCGIALGDEKTYLIETRLSGLMVENACKDWGAFYRLVSSAPDHVLRDKIVDAITTNETLWFRDQHPFVILREKLLPSLAEELKSGNRFRIRIWSAASSTGQEPYSIAMAIQEFCREEATIRPDQFEILATDISPSALFVASQGRYDQASVSRGLPNELLERYFTRQGPVWTLQDSVKKMVRLKKFNLQEAYDPLGPMDIVFCRYVAIYFNEALKRHIYESIGRLLQPSGHLIISAVESLQGITGAFQTLSHAGGTYYKVKGSGT